MHIQQIVAFRSNIMEKHYNKEPYDKISTTQQDLGQKMTNNIVEYMKINTECQRSNRTISKKVILFKMVCVRASRQPWRR